LQYGAARLSASATSLIMLTEVVFASGSAVALGAGELTTRTLIGGALIVLASLLSAMTFSAPAADK
jgi:drug/metabolite transporter (DMT)-like permease